MVFIKSAVKHSRINKIKAEFNNSAFIEKGNCL